MKKYFISFALVFALLATCLVGCAIVPDDTASNAASDVEVLKADAAAVFTLDVNPGVRIYVKEDNTVIAVEATNDDGEEVVAELEINGLDYETVVEEIIDKLEEKGYLEGESNSILISVEKKVKDISEKVNKKISEAFEKHGKKASVIEQDLDELDEQTEKAIGEIAEKYRISEGKARLIEQIRGEFPELPVEELASLKVNDLGIMLEETSDDVKEQFKRIGKAIEDDYVGRQEALNVALESLELTLEDVTMPRVHITRDDGKMLYEVEFVYDGMEYEITIDAESGEILATESIEFKEIDAKEIIDSFCKEHNIGTDAFRDHMFQDIPGFGEWQDKWHDGSVEEKLLTKSELLKSVMEELGISAESLKRTEVMIHNTESGTVFSVTIENDAGDVYSLVVEAYTGTIIRAELNGTTIEITIDSEE